MKTPADRREWMTFGEFVAIVVGVALGMGIGALIMETLT